MENPTVNDDLVTELRYIGGSPCQENRYKQLSTNISFICSNDTQVTMCEVFQIFNIHWPKICLCKNVESKKPKNCHSFHF